MDQNRLITKIHEKVARIETEILEKAEHDRDAIIADTDKQVATMKAKVMERVKSQADRLRDRKYNTIRFHANARRYELKSDAIEDIWREAARIVERIASSDEYRVVLEHLFAESAADAPDGSVVVAAPGDAEQVRAMVGKSGRSFTVTENPDIRWGIEFRWPNGTVTLRNTLEHRITRLREEGNATISAVLFGDKTE